MRTIQLTDEVHQRVKELAAKMDCSMNQYVAGLLGMGSLDKRVKHDFTDMVLAEERFLPIDPDGTFFSIARSVSRHNKKFAPKRWAADFNTLNGGTARITRVI